MKTRRHTHTHTHTHTHLGDNLPDDVFLALELAAKLRHAVDVVVHVQRVAQALVRQEEDQQKGLRAQKQEMHMSTAATNGGACVLCVVCLAEKNRRWRTMQQRAREQGM